MILYPKDIFEKIEFNKVLKAIKEYCLGDLGKKHFDHIEIHTELPAVKLLLEQTGEWLQAMVVGDNMPFGRYEDVSDCLPLLKKEGYVLEVEDIQKIHQILSVGSRFNHFFQDYTKHKLYPKLTEIGLSIIIEARLNKEIERVFDEEGEVRPNASDELLKISKAIGNKEREAAKVFRQELMAFKEKGFLVENLESIRNGRMVFVVAAEHKRKVPGIIHDESSTGKTVFIEPEQTIAINNDIHSLYSERRAEIYRIVRELCAFLRPFADDIFDVLQKLIKVDTIRAKAQFSKHIDGRIPQVSAKSNFNIIDGYNPILLLKNDGNRKNVVPFTLQLFGNNTIMVLSGPNAGGKSVAMKSCGLLQLMLQAGIPVPVDENSQFGIYHKIFVDIGDQQSVEDDLSTYSSHLLNMKNVLEASDAKTMVLIDEFGSGTDPKIGGAIAEAILNELNRRKTTAVITTHYSNLKFFAFKTKGIVNASMEFDRNELSPTYKLIVGKPGSSFAFEIATKTGIPEEVLKYARHKTGKNEKAVEELLVELQTERKEYEDKMTKLLEKEDRLDKLMKNYELLQSDMEFKKKKFKIEQKEASLYSLAEANKEAQKLIKAMKQEKEVEKVEEMVKAQKTKFVEVKDQINQLKEDVYQVVTKKQKPFSIGDYVKIQEGSSIGQIMAIDKDQAEIQMGILTLRSNLKELVHANEPIVINKKKTVDVSNVSGIGGIVETKLDIRGYRTEDAMWFLEEFIDRAIMNNAFELRIIHGVGNGVLKKNVHKKLRDYKDVKEFWHPEPDYGGEGVTLVRL